MKKGLSIILSIVMVLSILAAVPFTASAEMPASGSCGTDVYYNFDAETGALYIGGTGAMTNYNPMSDSPFMGKEEITKIFVSPGVTGIGYGAFFGCSYLLRVVLPTTVTTIDEFAFGGCNALRDIDYFGSEAQWNAITIRSNNLKKFQDVQKNYGTASCGENVTYSIDENTGVFTVSGTGDMDHGTFDSDPYHMPAYYYTTFREIASKIVVENGVTGIGYHAFCGFENVQSVSIADTVTSIEEMAFSYCRSLNQLTLGNEVSSLDYAAFYCCESLKSVDIPVSLKTIGDDAFMSCSKLSRVNYAGTKAQWQSIAIGKNNEELQRAAVYCSDESFGGIFAGSCGANAVYRLDVKTGVLEISGTGNLKGYEPAESPFDNNSDIKSIVIEDGITGLGKWTFTSCDALESVSLPQTLTSIGVRVFSGCSKLESIVIPGNVTDIGNFAFSGCSALTDITLPEGLSAIGAGCFSGCSALKTIFLPEGITTLENLIFSGCTALEEVGLPTSVTTIIYNAFSNTNDTFTVTSGCQNSTMVGKLTKDTQRTWNKTHRYTSKVTPPTCTEYGYTTYTCTDCGAYYPSNYVKPIAHTPGEAKVEKEIKPDCTTPGSYEEVYYCTGCGTEISRKTVKVEPTGHSFFDTSVVKPTSVKAGYYDQACSVCGAKKRVITAPTGKVKTVKCKKRSANAETVNWSAVKGAPGYQIQISTKDGKKWDKTYNAKTATSYTFKKLAAGGTYKFRVRIYAKAVDGSYAYGEWTKALTSPTLPAGTSITKLTPAKKSFTAQWKKQANATGYQIQYGTKSNFSGAKTVTVKSAKTLKTTVKKLSAKKTYYVRIRTYKTISKVNYFSTWSKAVKVKTK